MGFINLFVGSQVYASIEKNQFKLTKQENKESITYPLEDINSVVFDNNLGTISMKTICALAENNIITYFCDERHLPQTYLISYNSFYKNLSVYKKQTDVKKPTLKNIWKNIVKQKIENQMAVLDCLKIKHNLYGFLDKVQSDDTTNIEAVVANKYFKLLFGENFTRRDDRLKINGALNYGYAILRGAFARTVVAHGLQPFLGVHHISELNNFNLVDDLIECFRPVVDLFVANNQETFSNELTTSTKMSLVNLMNADVVLKGQKVATSYAIDMVVESYVKCLSENDFNISLPKVIELEMHRYE